MAWNQVIIDYFNNGKGLGFWAELNYGKFCLNFACMCCCLVFLVQHYFIYWENNKLAAKGLPIPGVGILSGAEKKELEDQEEGLGDVVEDLISTSHKEYVISRSGIKRRASMVHGGGNIHRDEMKYAMKMQIFDTIMKNRAEGGTEIAETLKPQRFQHANTVRNRYGSQDPEVLGRVIEG